MEPNLGFCGCCACKCCFRLFYEGRTYLDYRPSRFWSDASKEAQELVLNCFGELDPSEILDCHVHVLASGPPKKNGCYLHKNWYNGCCHPLSGLKRRALLLIAGVDPASEELPDDQYMSQITECFAHFLPPDMQREGPGVRASMLGMDEWYDKDGQCRPDKTSIYVCNNWVNHVTTTPETRRKHFSPTPSIHPYRPDCVEQLHYWHKRGCRQIKWLPPTQGIDPADKRCDKFYEAMAKLNPPMFLLSHTGNEHSLNDSGAGIHKFGNPLRLRRALNLGVHVIAAHVCSLGMYKDIESKIKPPPNALSMDLLLRLLEDPKYDGLMFADISGITSWTRISLTGRIFENTHLHKKLIYASDYPVVAMNFVVWISLLTYVHDLIPRWTAPLLREIHYYNPCLGDFVKKRIMRWKKDGKTIRLPDEIFQRGHLIYGDIINNQKAEIREKKS